MTNSKPWKSEPGGRQLEAYIGAFGVKTGGYAATGELIAAAAQLFEVAPLASCKDMADAITALGPKRRRQRARKNAPLLAATGIGAAQRVASEGLEKMMAQSSPQLVDGSPFDIDGQVDIDPAKLLRKVVSAVISSGHAEILWEFPDVLAFFKARLPTADEVAGLHNVNPKMLR